MPQSRAGDQRQGRVKERGAIRDKCWSRRERVPVPGPTWVYGPHACGDGDRLRVGGQLCPEFRVLPGPRRKQKLASAVGNTAGGHSQNAGLLDS